MSAIPFIVDVFESEPSFQFFYLVQRQLDHHLALARMLKVAGLDDLGGRAGVEAAAAPPAKAATAATAAAAAAKRRSASSAAGGEASSAPASSAAREASAASTAIHLVVFSSSLSGQKEREREGKRASLVLVFEQHGKKIVIHKFRKLTSASKS
jgi:hypothetical protein